jgi:glycosyltransferase involved in cell wall biosynthesis
MIRDAWGGSEELWYEMAKVALKQGHKIIHVGYETPEKHIKIKELEALGLIQIDRPGWIPSGSSAVLKFGYLGWNYLRKKINAPIKKAFSCKPDIAVYNGTCYSIANEKELLALIKKENFNFYIIGNLNNETSRQISDRDVQNLKQTYQRCKKVFFVSERNLQVAKRHLCQDILNAAIIRNPVNLSSIDQLPFPSTEATIQLACVGNLVTIHKGQDILLEALSRWENKNWILNIYGGGTDIYYLQNLAKYLQIEDHVIFHGTVKNVREIWKQNHALVMGSHMEGMPLAVVEAMLCGRICIVPDVGGNAEWITHKKNGFIAETSTVKALLYAIETAYSVKEEWSQIALDAHKTASQLYDPNAGATLLNRIIAK